ncbi:MAG TPA: outer membrane protein transport protein [Eoetvoesiella sp.]
MQKGWRLLGVASAIFLGLGPATAGAAGFQLIEQNASGVGNAYAGSAAIADNASTIFYNPAGMTRLPGVNVSGGLTLVKPSFKFSNDGSTGPRGFPVGSNNGGDAGVIAALPNSYASWQVNPELFVGLGIGAPFGLKTKYDNDWVGRYHSTKFGIKTVNINPSVAYRISDKLSLGAGLNWQYLDADYRRNVFAGTLPDMNAKVKLKGDAWGWNLGMLYQITPDTRVGLSYRSTMRFHATGTTTLSNRPTGLPSLSADARTSVKLPDTAILSVAHDVNKQWQLLADVSWTGWSSIPSLDIDSGSLGSDSLKLDFRDTWRVALGAHYKYSQKWLFKGGMAYDQTPVAGAALRPTSLPDNDRIWLTMGVQYNINESSTLDVGYAHIFVRNPSINNSSAAAKGTIAGKYSAAIDLFGVQLSHRF